MVKIIKIISVLLLTIILNHCALLSPFKSDSQPEMNTELLNEFWGKKESKSTSATNKKPRKVPQPKVESRWIEPQQKGSLFVEGHWEHRIVGWSDE